MKNRIVVFFLACVMSLSFAVPIMANAVVATETVYVAEYEEISPFTEMTRMYWRNYHGQLQWRLWSMTNARWLTEWTTATPV